MNLSYAEQGGRQEDVDLGPFCQVHYGLLLQPYKRLLMVVTAIRTMLKAWAELQNVSDMADIYICVKIPKSGSKMFVGIQNR